ncbi:C-terminal processing peptidase-3. Serine peptidase. MEROPS family S41A [Filimonas lacunae]|uniref:C-terminal processing peptidase-3. Serine peptidase. MEROPS family S41A n=1 Tax=Filimonas lacunae TaxID=477680 RepID=A0A173ML73_9BACT|nr:S41 family peptidase [Filimonas lacunae]BAV08219.1 carboxy-terminal processing protease [Filimonas lacunae]SIT33072.1 C-terminal processing peptidase-3. Serine peptidase. MEROPS family S41A [Filimonas lacunae]
MVSKKLKVWLPLLFALVLTAGMFLGFKLRGETVTPGFFQNAKKNSLQEVYDLVRSRYVDDINQDSLSNAVIEDVLAHLDPHSVYIPPVEVEGATEDLNGNFQGIGVEFQVFSDTVNVLNVIENGPSYKAGLEVGDKILAVNDTAMIAGKKIKADDVKKLLRGAGGSKVVVTVLRNGDTQKITITRGTIPLPSLDVAYMLTPETGFIRLNKFSETTYQEFMFNLETLQKKGMKKLVLDLRGNGGGYMSEAVAIADQFLSDTKLIVYTEGSKTPRQDYNAKLDGLFEKGQLVVLVDETSASASEILAGALQDWDRATIIGRRTFGKGLVQQPFQLSDGGMLRLTIARYYTPLGRNIQKPYNKGKDKYEDDLIERLHNGELVKADTSTPKGKAYKTAKGHTVYGGGGITPDIFVPFDTASQPRQIIELYLKGTLNSFVYNYYVNNKSFFKQFKSATDFARDFNAGDKEWEAISNYARRDSIDLKPITGKSKTDFLQTIKAYLARQIWRTEGYFEVMNMQDPMIKKALEQ